MDEERVILNQFVFKEDPEEIFHEIRDIASDLIDDAKCDLLEQVFKDTGKLFRGEYEGYRASNTNYHDFDHTIAVGLATARLIHGGHLEGRKFSPQNAVLAMIAALFHDTGLIQVEGDVKGSGAKYTIGHEERSIAFMRQYLSREGISDSYLDNCAHFIRCTILSLPPKEIPFVSEETETLGHIVGTADLLAQMADRIYLEKLLLLYKEFEEARLPGFESEVMLLQKTEDFFDDIADKRLSVQLGGVYKFMQTHFRERWEIDKDLYTVSILKNIDYLKSLNMKCSDSFTCYLKNLKRGGIAERITARLNKKQ